MSIVVDANIAIAVLDTDHRLHRVALARCLAADEVVILNITRAEALIYPARADRLAEADAELEKLGFRTRVLENPVAERARDLRAEYGNRNFPMVDAVVVALGLEMGCPVVTGDTKWPAVVAATIEVLGPASGAPS